MIPPLRLKGRDRVSFHRSSSFNGGITLREYYAIESMRAMISRTPGRTFECVAKEAVRYADSLLEALEAPPEGTEMEERIEVKNDEERDGADGCVCGEGDGSGNNNNG